MKRFILLSCIFALALTACRKPEPGIGPNGETVDTLVKKYLVKTYISNPDEPEKIIGDFYF